MDEHLTPPDSRFKGTWIGTECEGRWRGLPTLFVGDDCDAIAIPTTVCHVYFNPGYLQRCGYDTVRHVLGSRAMVATICLTPEMLLHCRTTLLNDPRVHVVLTLNVPEASKLGYDHSLRIVLAEHHVLQAPVSSFRLTKPYEYLDDQSA